MTQDRAILSGYQILDPFYIGPRILLYRAVRQRDQRPVLLKVLWKDYPSFREILQLRHQYALVRSLAVDPHIAQPLALENYRNGLALVLEDPGGIPLADWSRPDPLSLDRFFPIALSLSRLLDRLHQQSIIHKNFNPNSFLVNPETLHLSLIDLGLASRLPREAQSATSPNTLEGTLAYLSPEQTGRMNRGVDYRTDFYALGVTLYELLTGQVPFSGQDAMEVIHAHLAKIPPLVNQVNPQVPLALGRVVLKLMAKMPEDRYQSAAGLSYDLDQCWRSWQDMGSIAPFPLGQQDISDRFVIAERLYGRTEEVQTLLATFDRVSEGSTELVLVTGSSGVGKTAVVSEVHKPIVRQRGYFIQGKFDQFQHNLPFQGFVLAFQDLVEQLLSETATQIENWKTAILEAIAPDAQVLVDVIPALEQLMGPQPPVAHLVGSAAQTRLNRLMQRLIGVFATRRHPLVMFLDDLQWADVASLRLIQALLLEHPGYLLVIGAYRDNEVQSGHPLGVTLRDLAEKAKKIENRAADFQIHEIKLLTLGLPALSHWIADTLLRTPVEVAPLVELVFQKTEGNPFFSVQLLRSLHEQGLIYSVQGSVKGSVQGSVQRSVQRSHLAPSGDGVPLAAPSLDGPSPSLGFGPNSGPPSALSLGAGVNPSAHAHSGLEAGPSSSLLLDSFQPCYHWAYDLEAVQQLSVDRNVVDFVVQQLQQLPQTTQTVLTLAACIGNQFSLRTLATVYRHSRKMTADHLWPALQKGYLFPEDEVYKFYQAEAGDSGDSALAATQYPLQQGGYRFAHDRIQQAAYTLISEAEKQAIHCQIGQILLQELEEWMGRSGVTSPSDSLAPAVIPAQANPSEPHSPKAGSKGETVPTGAMGWAKILAKQLADTLQKRRERLELEAEPSEAPQSGDFTATEVLGPQQAVKSETRVRDGTGAQDPVSGAGGMAAMGAARAAIAAESLDIPTHPLQNNLFQGHDWADRLFAITNHLNLGESLLLDRETRSQLAQLNLRSGQQAQEATAYQTAIAYFFQGIRCLNPLVSQDNRAIAVAVEADPVSIESSLTVAIAAYVQDLPSWHHSYTLTLRLYEAATEAAYLSTNFTALAQLRAVVLRQARTLTDTVKVEEVMIQGLIAQDRMQEAVDLAFALVHSLDPSLNLSPSLTSQDLRAALVRLHQHLESQPIAELLNLPPMTDPAKLAVMAILPTVAPAAYSLSPILQAMLALTLTELSMAYGNTYTSPLGYGLTAYVLCVMEKNIDLSYAFSTLALELAEKLEAKPILSCVRFVAQGFIDVWHRPVQTTLDPLRHTYQLCLEVGNLEYAGYSAMTLCLNSFLTGKSLEEVDQLLADYGEAMVQFRQEHLIVQFQLWRQVVFNWLGYSANPTQILGSLYNETVMLPQHQETNNRTTLAYFYLCKLMLSYGFGDYASAAVYAPLAREHWDGIASMFLLSVFYWYDSLVVLAALSLGQGLGEQQQERVTKNQGEIATWMSYAPQNQRHRYELVEAERLRVMGEHRSALEAYDRALELAHEHQYSQEEALIAERAALFCLEWGRDRIAQTYFTQAYYGYGRWGAQAKVEDLERRYGNWLNPLSFGQNWGQIAAIESGLSLSLSSALNPQANPPFGVTFGLGYGAGQGSSLGSATDAVTASNALDLQIILKASQVLSGEIQLDQLQMKFMQLVLEHAGAETGALLLQRGDQLCVEVQALPHPTRPNQVKIRPLPSPPLTQVQNLPVKLLNYVARLKKPLLMDETSGDRDPAPPESESPNLQAFKPSRFQDPYLQEKKPRSVLCLPILHQGLLIGVLYLENSLTSGVFTQDRLDILYLIASQAAISLENAQLYRQLQDYSRNLEVQVEERTAQLQAEVRERQESEFREREKSAELQEALKTLQKTQSQLVQTEKMSSLGQLVAGVAHEINNPVNFIAGNLEHVSSYADDLLRLVEAYGEYLPEVPENVLELAEEIDLEFIQEDLPKMIQSMKVGSDRIRKIVQGLRNFSRHDEAMHKAVDIHEGLESTLMILQSRLKAKPDRPEIEVVKHYGQLPRITCFASELNQVFMNLIANAIDALEGKWFDQIKAQDQAISEDLALSTPNVVQRAEEVPIPPLVITIETSLLPQHPTPEIHIRIRDTGTGIPPEIQAKLFDPFFTTKEVGKGTGLGLSISYQVVVDRHRGRLWSESELGQGTTFTIALPLCFDDPRAL
ncbi:MAG: AAA family ATPase [Prochlorothrix sp.]|nr:AAA family ATPase [Prochlorothrix sp.]